LQADAARVFVSNAPRLVVLGGALAGMRRRASGRTNARAFRLATQRGAQIRCAVDDDQ
jgi:hypothetical protein